MLSYFLCRIQIEELVTFFSLPVLRGILGQYLNHLALLVCAIFIFSSEYISEESLMIGESLLTEFYREFSALYVYASYLVDV